jgi:hypothetical protein
MNLYLPSVLPVARGDGVLVPFILKLEQSGPILGFQERDAGVY